MPGTPPRPRRRGDARRVVARRGLYDRGDRRAARGRRAVRRPRGVGRPRTPPAALRARDDDPPAPAPAPGRYCRCSSGTWSGQRAGAPHDRARSDRRGRDRAPRAPRPGRGALPRLRRFLARPGRPAGLGVQLHADGVLARVADTAPPGRARARHRHRERRARAPRREARRSRDRNRCERASARIHADQRGAERHRQRRDTARQPLRAGRRRDVRSHHVQRAVCDLARAAMAVPRRRAARRPTLGTRRSRSRRAPRRRRLRLRARQLARGVGGRPGRARAHRLDGTAATLGSSVSAPRIRSTTPPDGTSTSQATRIRWAPRSTSGRSTSTRSRRAGSARAAS